MNNIAQSPERQPPHALSVAGIKIMRLDVYILYHIWDDDDDDNALIMGIYATRRKSKKARKRAERQYAGSPGKGRFETHKSKIDRSGWLEGFIAISEAMENDASPRPLRLLFPELHNVSAYYAKERVIKGVYALTHRYVFWEDGDTEEKFLGIYSSESRSTLIREHAKTQPGFCNHPDGFITRYYRLNQDYFQPPDSALHERHLLQNGEETAAASTPPTTPNHTQPA